MSTLYPYKGHFPLVDPNTFLAPGARVIGDVTLAEGVAPLGVVEAVLTSASENRTVTL